MWFRLSSLQSYMETGWLFLRIIQSSFNYELPRIKNIVWFLQQPRRRVLVRIGFEFEGLLGAVTNMGTAFYKIRACNWRWV